MKRTALILAVAALFASGCTNAQPALAKLEVGKPAPAFTVTDANGKSHSLSDFAGKTVVLEWNNPECPFVKKHYAGNMQSQQKAATGKDVVWLSINSGKAGKQGHMDGDDAKAYIARSNASPTAYLLDTDSATGVAYGAKTTPHMYVIDGKGTLQYMGAIDSIPSADVGDIGDATQYVTQALTELESGKPVSVASTQPYGCNVKY
ncbi:MAG TPA: redoxin domain-containing protein [Candidatus Saccharimonadia bacterium]|nr:redoxin domain-containing protein [Candidatus Saccharimonadia bacterium]